MQCDILTAVNLRTNRDGGDKIKVRLGQHMSLGTGTKDVPFHKFRFVQIISPAP